MALEVIELKPVLEWPELNHQFDEPSHEVEHFDMKVNPECFESLLEEVGFDFPHIIPKLKLLIGHPEFEMAINKLVVDDRGGRQGFPPRIMSLLLKLSKLHTEKYGHMASNVSDPYYDATIVRRNR